MQSLESLKYRIISFTKRDTLTSFIVCVPFQENTWCIAPAETSSMLLNKSRDCRLPSLVPDCSGNILSSSLISVMLTTGFLYIGFIILRYAFLHLYLLHDFYLEREVQLLYQSDFHCL